MTDASDRIAEAIWEEVDEGTFEYSVNSDKVVDAMADKVLAALPEIIKGMVKPLEFVEQVPLNQHSMPVYLAETGSLTGYRIEEHRPSHGEPKGFWLALELNGYSTGLKREIETYAEAEAMASEHCVATILVALGVE